jgi:hypothetical protein
MGAVLAIGTLIGAKIAAAGAAAGGAIAAHPVLFGLGALSAGFGAYSSISAGAATRQAANLSADRARIAGESESERLRNVMAQNRLSYEGEATQAAVDAQQRQRRLRQIMGTQLALAGSGNVDINDIDPILSDTFSQINQEQSLDSLGSSIRRTGLNNEYTNLGLNQGTALINANQTAANYTSKGNAAYKQGLLSAGGTLLNFGMSFSQRGSVPKAKVPSVYDFQVGY